MLIDSMPHFATNSYNISGFFMILLFLSRMCNDWYVALDCISKTIVLYNVVLRSLEIQLINISND